MLNRMKVVNCFRSFTYWPLSQSVVGTSNGGLGCELLSFFHLLTFVTVELLGCGGQASCELLSFFHLLTFVTVAHLMSRPSKVLWIAFVLSLIDLCHSVVRAGDRVYPVVNCFRSFTYWPLSQLIFCSSSSPISCELLSFFHLLTFVTVLLLVLTQSPVLWIAFVLSLIDLCHSVHSVKPWVHPLWIAFVLSLIDLCHSLSYKKEQAQQVVNCFRSFTYWPLSQSSIMDRWLSPGCELLSFFHLLTFVTVALSNIIGIV